MGKQIIERKMKNWIDEVAPSPIISPHKPSTVPSLEPITEETPQHHQYHSPQHS